jgi:hypothetical protein
MTKKVEILFPQISQIFSADLRRFLKYNLENPRKSAEKICEICGKSICTFKILNAKYVNNRFQRHKHGFASFFGDFRTFIIGQHVFHER